MNRLGPRTYVTLLLSVMVILCLLDSSYAMSAEEKAKAKEQVVQMFYHAYNSYMDYAYPADELMPLSCKGRYRGSEPSRGDVDDTLGNFTLTLIDTLDTLAVIGDVEAFDEAVQNIVRDARFDSDVIVSVFETNIRVLGGLLGGHVMATFFKRRKLGLDWYNNELLTQAKEVGDRLLPAFNTSTGIPYPRINLKHGIVPQISSSHRDTCTACAGSMILEFAALSRLTGIAVYEEKARKAMDYLWQQRHRSSDLMGLIINVHSGDWIRRESGVGAGIDSYYEYVLKAYILLGDDDYLARFNKHYDAVMRYVSQGPMLMDVHMHKPNAISRNFMDALLAFWPGLQVLKGDLVPAIETHEMLYQVMQRHNFIPEAFTTDFRVHWSHHPLRPEFIESTYFLYKATGDPYYLEAGKKVLENLEEHARVQCGYAAIKNVKTGAHEDQMDSYVLAEMFKYLYLLFAERSDLLFDIDDFIFTTEAHLLPLALSIGNITAASASSLPKIRREVYNKFQVDLTPPVSDNYITTTITTTPNAESDAHEVRDTEEEEDGDDRMCPNLHATHADGRRYPHSVRNNIRNIVERVSPQQRSRRPRLRAVDFIAGNKEQLEQLHAMGIRIATMADGRIQLLHTASEAHSPEDAEDGMQFMQEMIELSKQQAPEAAQHDPMYIKVKIPGLATTMTLRAGPAQFGYDLRDRPSVSGMLAIARPFRVCQEVENAHELLGHIVILERGDCMFVDKARNLQRIGAKGGIVLDHTPGSSSDAQPLFAMSGDGTNDVDIPLVFLYHKEGHDLLKLLEENSFLEISLSASPDDAPQEPISGSCGQQEVTSDPAGSTGPDTIEAVSGQTEERQPPPLSQEQQPVEPPTTATDGSAAMEEEGETEDPFEKHINDKFYHHEAQLRDLYYLQMGSRYMHVNLEVRPSPTRPPPIIQRDNTFSLDVLPDGSKMMTLRLMYQSPGYEKHKPQLNQMYMDAVHLLQTHSNFNDLLHGTDYLRALARFMEAAYFGMSRVDNDAMYLMRDLSHKLQYMHPFPDQPQPPPVGWKPVGVETGENSDLPQSVPSVESLSHEGASYAQAEDFVEAPEHVKRGEETFDHTQSGSSDRSSIPANNDFVRAVPPGEGDAAFGARVGEDGVLNLVVDEIQQTSSEEKMSHVPASSPSLRSTEVERRDGEKAETDIRGQTSEQTARSSFKDGSSDTSATSSSQADVKPATASQQSSSESTASESAQPQLSVPGEPAHHHISGSQPPGDHAQDIGDTANSHSLPEGPEKDGASLSDSQSGIAQQHPVNNEDSLASNYERQSFMERKVSVEEEASSTKHSISNSEMNTETSERIISNKDPVIREQIHGEAAHIVSEENAVDLQQTPQESFHKPESNTQGQSADSIATNSAQSNHASETGSQRGRDNTGSAREGQTTGSGDRGQQRPDDEL